MTSSDLKIERTEHGIIIQVKALPGSRSNSIRGVVDGKLKISVTAPAEHGKANKAIVEFLASSLGVRSKQIELLSGTRSAAKRFLLVDCKVEILEQLIRNKSDYS